MKTQLNQTTDNLILVPNTNGGMTMMTQKSWDDFNAWCDAIHVDCDLNDPEIITYDREI